MKKWTWLLNKRKKQINNLLEILNYNTKTSVNKKMRMKIAIKNFLKILKTIMLLEKILILSSIKETVIII
jgi:hypothetical protein